MKNLFYKLISGSLLALVLVLGSGYAYAQTEEVPEVEVEKVEKVEEVEEAEEVELEVEVEVEDEDGEDEVEKVKEKINELRELYNALAIEVEVGDLTKEEARTEWKLLIENIREEKKIAFDKRMEGIKEKFSKIRERNSELADKLQTKYDEAQARRAEISLKRNEVANRVKAGEINGKQAFEMRKEDTVNFKAKIQEAQKLRGKRVEE